MATETLSYKAIKSASMLRECDEQKVEQRRKNMLIIVLQYLYDEGYSESAKKLEEETNLNMSRFQVCDNINLETILLDFESYYYVKFNRYPKIIKKLDGPEVNLPKHKTGLAGGAKAAKKTPSVSLPRLNSTSSVGSGCKGATGDNPPMSGNSICNSGNNTNNNSLSSNNNNRANTTNHTNKSKVNEPKQKGKPDKNGDTQSPSNNLDNLSPFIQSIGKSPSTHAETSNPVVIDYKSMIKDATRLNLDSENNSDDRLLKPLGRYYGYSEEWRELAQTVSKDIFSENPNVKWADIIGLENAKSIIKESVVYPIRFPQLFTGILSPWKGLLLYGPPGTGKTLLAKAVATECQTTFFNISASTIVSKWRGDSEKLVRVLFELARFHAPSTIFLDEIDALMGQRGGPNSEHEGSRRMKTELLVQMDGLAKSNDLVFLLAASNLPWELDHALLRRLEKRIMVGLPSKEARRAMFEHHLPPVVCPGDGGGGGGIELLSDIESDELALLTDGYSGSDIHIVCKEAAMRPLRKVFEVLESHDGNDDIDVKLDVVTTSDVKWAISKIKPSAKTLADKYLRWQKDFESS